MVPPSIPPEPSPPPNPDTPKPNPTPPPSPSSPEPSPPPPPSPNKPEPSPPPLSPPPQPFQPPSPLPPPPNSLPLNPPTSPEPSQPPPTSPEPSPPPPPRPNTPEPSPPPPSPPLPLVPPESPINPPSPPRPALPPFPVSPKPFPPFPNIPSPGPPFSFLASLVISLDVKKSIRNASDLESILKNFYPFQNEKYFSFRLFNTFEIITLDTNGTDSNDILRELKLYLCNTTDCDITISTNSYRRFLSTSIVFSVSISLTNGDILENTLTGYDIQTHISGSLNSSIVFEVKNKKTKIYMSYSGTISNTTVFHTALDVIKNMVLESSVSNITVVKDVEFIYPPYPPPHVPPNPPLLPSPPFPPPDMPSPPTPPSNPYIASPYSPEPSPPPPPEPSAPEPSPPPPPEPRTPEPSPPPPSPQSPPPPDLSPSPPFPPPGPPEPPPSPPSLPFPPSPPPAPPSSPPIPLIPPKPPASPPLPPLKPPPPPSPPPPQSPNPPPRPPKPPSPPPSPPSPPSEPPSPPSPPSPPASPPFPPFSPPPPPCPPRPPPYPFLPIYIRPTGCEGQEYCKNYCCNLADEDCSGQTCVVQSKDFCYNEINSLPSQFKGFRSNYDPQKPFYPAYSQIATQSQITETHRQKKNKDYCDVNKSPCICVIDFQYACNSTFMRLGISLDSSYVQVLHSKNFAYTTGASFTCEYDPPKPPSSPFPPFPPPVPPIPPLLPPDPPSKPPPPFVPPPPSLPPSPPPDAPPPNPYPPPPPRPPPPSPPPPQPPPSPPPYPPPPPGRPPFPPVIIYGDFVENTSRTYVQADLVCKINDNYPLYADLYDAINECNKVHNCKGVYSYNCLDFNYTICTDEGYASETNPLCSDTTIKNIKYNKRFKFKIPTVDAGQTIYQVIAGAIGGLAGLGLLSLCLIQRFNNKNKLIVNKNIWKRAIAIPSGTNVIKKYPNSKNLQDKFKNATVIFISDNEWEVVGNNIDINFNDYFESNGNYYVPTVTVESL